MGTHHQPHEPLHIAFFPMPAPGHTIPTLDMVRLFSARNVRTTILTTPLNAPTFANSLKKHPPNAALEILPFPHDNVNPPQDVQSMDRCTSPETFINFIRGAQLLAGPLEEFLDRTRPDCLVADMFFSFAGQSGAKFGVPVIDLHGTSFFSLCVTPVLMRDKPYVSVSSDEDPFSIPGLPHRVTLTRW